MVHLSEGVGPGAHWGASTRRSKARRSLRLQEPLIAVRTANGRYADTMFLDGQQVVQLEEGAGLLLSEDERFIDETFVNGVADMVAIEQPEFGPADIVAALVKLAEAESSDRQAMVGVLSA